MLDIEIHQARSWGRAERVGRAERQEHTGRRLAHGAARPGPDAPPGLRNKAAVVVFQVNGRRRSIAGVRATEEQGTDEHHHRPRDTLSDMRREPILARK